jgi:hypothetical protein
MRTQATLFAAAALIVSAAAGAQEATPDTWMHESNSAPVAVVQPAAKAVAPVAASKPAAKPAVAAPVAQGKTRAEVRAELEASRRSGEFAILSAEAYSFPNTPARIAEPVMAEVKTGK